MKYLLLALALLCACSQKPEAMRPGTLTTVLPGIDLYVDTRHEAEVSMKEDNCTDPGKGTGLSSDGGGWVQIPEAGTYAFSAPMVGFEKNPDKFTARVYRILPHEGVLHWTRPDGVREPVPTKYLFPAST